MNFKQKYKREHFLDFLKRFLPAFEKDVRPVNSGNIEVIQKVSLLGQSTSSDLDLQVFEITHTSSADARVSLATAGFRIMKDHGIFQALMIYQSEESDDWRLSLLTANPEIGEKKKIAKKLSNPRRYSFLLGPNAKTHTPEVALKDQVKDFHDLKNRFSIEVVNKDFYAQVATLFTKLAGGKRGEGRTAFDAGKGCLDLVAVKEDKVRKEFAVRLVGRLVFCWFLKKKSSKAGRPLLSDEVLSSGSVKKNKNFYHKILEPLFFQVLNEPVDTRPKEYRSQPWSDTPFLNGGLFGPHENDYYEPGVMGISKYINTLKIPDEWFVGLFEIFELYNFTIDENTSVDVELSVEPEMLGRIFENLLAEINPETGETARKSTGSYYTPRPIVEYMVDESLKQYLASKTKISQQKIAALLAYDYEPGEITLSKTEQEAVIKALDGVKIIDPACGSGAFPMGVLQKMLLILQKVDPCSDGWLEKQLAKIENSFYRKEFEKKLRSENVNYVYKLGIIQSSIYGVDIQPIAVEISKLRFFLSLIVDENVNDAKPNRGVQHLPNLEFKFVCANSLISLPKLRKDDELFAVEDHESIAKLKILRENYLNSSGKEKESIRLEFQQTQSAMMDFYFKSFKRQGDLFGNEKKLKKQQDALSTQLLGSWEPFTDKSCDWFDPEWMFGIKDGFDIVIANPPYGAEFSEDHKKILKGKYDYIVERIRNSFLYFLGLAYELCGSNGVISFIIPNEFLFQIYMSKARKFFLENSQILYALNVGEDVFEAIVPTCVLGLAKTKKETYDIPIADLRDAKLEELPSLLVTKNFSITTNKQILSSPNSSFSFNPRKTEFINRLIADSEPFEKYCDDIANGISTSCDEVYIVSKKCSEENAFEKKYLRECIRGSQFNRFYCPPHTGEYILYITGDFNPEDGENIYRYLSKHKNLLSEKSIEKKHGTRAWHVLFRSRYESLFIKPKIIFRQTGDRIFAAVDRVAGYYCIDSVNVGQIKKEHHELLDYFVGLFNSKLMVFFYQEISQEKGRVLAQVKPNRIRCLPVKIGTVQQCKVIVDLVNRISALMHKDQPQNISELETQLDRVIYQLYGLSKDEIAMVEDVSKS